MKTLMPKQIQTEDRKWFVIDAKDKNLWELATKIAIYLKGKHKFDYAPHVDNWDYVVVINASKFQVSWNKMKDKKYYRHTGYLGWLIETSLEKMLEKKPLKPVEFAVRWMLPKNKLRKQMLSRLKLVNSPEHNFMAQKPKELSL